MGQFKPCLGKTACREEDGKCHTCGRSFEEIFTTREMIQGLVDLALASDYDNVDEFAAYVARRIIKKVQHERESASAPRERRSSDRHVA